MESRFHCLGICLSAVPSAKKSLGSEVGEGEAEVWQIGKL